MGRSEQPQAAPSLAASDLTSPKDTAFAISSGGTLLVGASFGVQPGATAAGGNGAGSKPGAEVSVLPRVFRPLICPFTGVTDFDEREFLLASKRRTSGPPKRNHTVRLDDVTMRAVEILIERAGLGYETKSDFFGHAIERWVHVLTHLVEIPEAVELLRRKEAISNLLEEEAMSIDHVEKLTLAREIVHRLERLPGADRRIWQVLRRMQDEIAGMPDGYWKRVWIEGFETEFGERMKQGEPSGALIPMGDEEGGERE